MTYRDASGRHHLTHRSSARSTLAPKSKLTAQDTLGYGRSPPSDTTDYVLTSTFVMCPDLGDAKPQAVGMGVQLPLGVFVWPIAASAERFSLSVAGRRHRGLPDVPVGQRERRPRHQGEPGRVGLGGRVVRRLSSAGSRDRRVECWRRRTGSLASRRITVAG